MMNGGSLMSLMSSQYINTSIGEILLADVHKPQQADHVSRLFQNNKAVPLNVIRVYPSRVQLFVVYFNNPFKNSVKEQMKRLLNENLDVNVDSIYWTACRQHPLFLIEKQVIGKEENWNMNSNSSLNKAANDGGGRGEEGRREGLQ